MFIAFLGCDGSGKSAVIAGVTDRLKASGVKVAHGHWRPRAFGGGAGGGAEDPHGQMPRGTLSSILKLGWLWLNWWSGWLRFLGKSSAEGVILFDRYHADLLIDPKRYRYGGPMFLARLASALMPQPDIAIFLDAPPEVLLSRKQEVSREALKHSRAAYRELSATHPRFRVIDAKQPLEQVVERVFSEIMQARGKVRRA